MSDFDLPEGWEIAYESERDGWDLGGPAAVFTQLAASGRFTSGPMLVPGAGRGHDAREFARHGFSVAAVDFTAYAVQEMQRLAEPEAPLEIVQQDIFALPETFDQAFTYEGHNRQLRKVTKTKGSFPSAEAARKLLFLVTREITRKWTMPPQDWARIRNQLAIRFAGRFPPE